MPDLPPRSRRQRLFTRGRGVQLPGIAAAAAIVLVARASFADHYHVPSGSMEPSIEVGDRIVVNKAAYGLRVPLTSAWLARWNGPHRGDVVVLESPDDGKVLLKRVAGLPGDEIAVVSGALLIDGAPATLEADARGAWVEHLGDVAHAVRLDAGGGPDFGPLRIPPDTYLVLGDNRGNSRDGRTFGLIAGRVILGRAEAVVMRSGAPAWQRLP